MWLGIVQILNRYIQAWQAHFITLWTFIYPCIFYDITDDEGDMNGEEEYEYIPQASNVYPLHLLMTTNYRLPGDVDRCNLERHLTDAEFDAVFKCLRDEFYRLPYWKRCDLKRRIFLF